MASSEPAPSETKVYRNSSHPFHQSRAWILSDETRGVLEIVLFAALNIPISVMGAALNVVNILIFVKQGFSDSVNISLCALAVSDLGALLTMAWVGICSNPLFQNSDIDFDYIEVYYLTGGLPHSCFVRITSLITAFITFERCVCVALPLRVKNIITPRRTLVSIVAMSAIVIAAGIPIFTSTYLGASFHTKRNKTLIGLMYTSSAQIIEGFTFSFSVSTQLGSFIIVVICTIMLVLKLLYKSAWRHRAMSASGDSDSLSTRDKRVLKMVTSISVSFILCYFLDAVNLIVKMMLSPEYSVTGQLANLLIVAWAIICTIEGVNSSANTLVYYNMSSKFRSTFKEIFFTARQMSVKYKKKTLKIIG